MARKILSALCCVLVCGSAFAAPADRPCKADLEKYCAAARGDRAKMGQCMREHFTEFTPACQAKMKERAQAHGGAAQSHDGTAAPAAPGT